MSTAPNKKIDWDSFGWAILGLLSLFAWLVTMIGQFIGVAWYFPWIFFGLFVFLVMKTSKSMKAKEDTTMMVSRTVMSPNELREAEYKLPHLTSIPGQYTRKPCENPEWIQIPLYRNYEINCSSLVVRHRIFKDVVVPGHDPNGKNDRSYLELLNDHDVWVYVPHEWIVSNALGRGHK
jgi:hypothetical protein